MLIKFYSFSLKLVKYSKFSSYLLIIFGFSFSRSMSAFGFYFIFEFYFILFFSILLTNFTKYDLKERYLIKNKELKKVITGRAAGSMYQ